MAITGIKFLLPFSALFYAIAPTHAQTVIYSEDFENRTGTTPVKLNTYLSSLNTAAGPEYTANTVYLTLCNGWVVKWNDDASGTVPTTNPPNTDCGTQQIYNGAQQISQVIGLANGQSTTAARNNVAVSGYTAGLDSDYTGAAANGSIIEMTGANRFTLGGVPAGGNYRFLTMTIDVGVANCGINPPSLTFAIISNAGAEYTVGTGTANCSFGTSQTAEAVGVRGASSGFRAGRMLASGNLLYTGGNGHLIGFRIHNGANSQTGNDYGFDNVRILDVSPTLSKSAPALSYIGKPVTMTFTITNTVEDNQDKTGWSFTDTLPSGMVVAPTPNAVTTCAAATIAATAGAGSIAVTNGSLAAGTSGGTATSCTIKVDVVRNTIGTTANIVSNGDATADNISSSRGLNLTNQTVTTEWAANRLTITKVSQGGTGTFAFSGNNGIANHNITTATAGTGVAGTQQTLDVNSTTSNTTITEATQAGWNFTSATCTGLAAGQTASVSGNTITLPFAGLSLVSGGRTVACTVTNTAFSPLALTKTSQVYSDPVNGTTRPKAIPGSYVNYAITINAPTGTNPTNNSVYLLDTIPANTALYVNTFAPGPGPVVMNAGSSALTYSFTSLASTTDDIDFSNNGGATWTYVPVPDANGVDSNVTNIRINPKGTMATGSSITVNFRVRVK